MMKNPGFDEILLNYGLDPASCTIAESRQGHINDSYVVETGRGKPAFFLQRINHHVFSDPEALINNLIRVNEAMQRHYGRDERNPYPAIRMNRNKKYFHRDRHGNFWRLTDYVADSRSYDIAMDETVAQEGAAAFGRFQLVMNEEDPALYTPTIPDFHNLGMRMHRLQEAVEKDSHGRRVMAGGQITFAFDRLDLAGTLGHLLREGIIPVRVTHNDTKLNNVLFRDDGTTSICVVDLDTVMPGTVLYDYGDMVRTFTSPAQEDEQDPSKVIFRKNIFDALTRGYLSELRHSLTAGEKEHLLFGARVMLLMIGVRFLTDFLEGDHYFKTSRKNHNLERCRNQFVLLSQLEAMEQELQGIIRRHSAA